MGQRVITRMRIKIFIKIFIIAIPIIIFRTRASCARMIIRSTKLQLVLIRHSRRECEPLVTIVSSRKHLHARPDVSTTRKGPLPRSTPYTCSNAVARTARAVGRNRKIVVCTSPSTFVPSETRPECRVTHTPRRRLLRKTNGYRAERDIRRRRKGYGVSLSPPYAGDSAHCETTSRRGTICYVR